MILPRNFASFEAMETSDDHDGGDTKESVMRLLQYVLNAQGKGWQLGTSRVFLRDEIDVLSSALQRLQREREAALRTRSAHIAGRDTPPACRAKGQQAPRGEQTRARAQRRRELEEREQRKEALRKMAEVERRREAAAQKVQAHARRRIRGTVAAGTVPDGCGNKTAEPAPDALCWKVLPEEKSAAMVLQKVARGHAKRKFMSSKIGSATSIQAWRGRMKGSDSVMCRPSVHRETSTAFERVHHLCLACEKRAEKGMAKVLGFQRRRQLLYTSQARLLYVCPEDGRARGG